MATLVFHLYMLFFMVPTTIYGRRCWHTPGTEKKPHEFVNWNDGKPEAELIDKECGHNKYCSAIMCPHRNGSGVHGEGLMACTKTMKVCDLLKKRPLANPCLRRGDSADHLICKSCEKDLCNTADWFKSFLPTNTTKTEATTLGTNNFSTTTLDANNTDVTGNNDLTTTEDAMTNGTLPPNIPEESSTDNIYHFTGKFAAIQFGN